ncbi:MAG: hypothetical protein R6V57_01130, partial [Vicinamibacterales bacterium]
QQAFPEINIPETNKNKAKQYISSNHNGLDHAIDAVLISEFMPVQNATVDQIVSVALAAQVSAWRTRESISSRAARVNWEKVDDILARVPDVPPDPGDEL